MNIQRLYLLANARRERAVRTLAVVKAWCGLHDIDAVPLDRGVDLVENGLVVALGGDGTVLRAASMVEASGLPILGANFGSLGFLTQATASALTQALESVLRDEFDIEERMRLAFAAGGRAGTVLNDVVVAGPARARFCEVELRASMGLVASLAGDGLIVSTSTGSTAYSLSSGGPIIVPPAACLLATPLAPHTLGVRPIVFPPEEQLEILTRSAVTLFADGDVWGELEAGTAITIQRASEPTRLVRLRGAAPFFRVLREKLNWGEDRPGTADLASSI